MNHDGHSCHLVLVCFCVFPRGGQQPTGNVGPTHKSKLDPGPTAHRAHPTLTRPVTRSPHSLLHPINL